MIPRWWRIGVLFEEGGEPWTWTFHVRARTEDAALRLVRERMAGRRFAIHACHPSEPLPRAPRDEEIAAAYGPYRRSWADPQMERLRDRLSADG